MTASPPHAHTDVIVVGAGISGICAGHYLQTHCPDRSYVILEARSAIGGTWDLFRYPGIRSDSDMYTLGFGFRPWPHEKAIAEGATIRAYLEETAREEGIDARIRFGHKVIAAAWSSAEARWIVDVETADGRVRTFTCNFLFMCSGYYEYEEGFTPELPGIDAFRGKIIHPQHWPEDLDYAGKRIVVIGSGATAVTLVPELARTAADVVMLQRSPTYVVSRPAADPLARWLRRRLPLGAAYKIVRWRNILLGMYFFNRCRRAPEKVRDFILRKVKEALPEGYDVDRHFTPGYKPWDQRLCLVPDGDLFEAISEGRARVVTDTIETFTEDGIRLASGETLKADIVVTATGLKLKMLGGTRLTVDGRPVSLPETMSYKGLMFSDIPNLAASFGYTNASWTLKCELTCQYVCRLLNHMRAKGLRQCTPRLTDPSVEERPWLDLTSNYVKRSVDLFPRQGNKLPWRLHQNYARDIVLLRLGAVEDGSMEFSNPEPEVSSAKIAR